MAKQKMTELVRELMEGFTADSGIGLWDVEFVKEGRDRFLRVYIDRQPENGEERYVSTDDCELVSRYLSEKLDELDPVEENYYLEVSSPGMDRALTRPEHFARFAGHEIEISLYRALDGRKKYSGVLEGLEGDTVAFTDADGARREIKLADTAKIRLAVVF